MYPVLFEYSDLIIPSWHIFVAIGAIAGYNLLIGLGSNTFSNKNLKRIFILAYVSGLFGARWLTVLLQEPHSSFSETIQNMFSIGGMTFYGGAISGAGVTLIYILMFKLNLKKFLDISIPCLLVGLGFGRIGCFLNGCDYGIALENQNTSIWWASANPILQDGLLRYPVQIFEAITSLLIAICIIYIRKKRLLKDGISGSVGIILYGCSRFILEYYRGDDRGPFTMQLSPSQCISLIILTLAGFQILYLQKNNASHKTIR